MGLHGRQRAPDLTQIFSNIEQENKRKDNCWKLIKFDAYLFEIFMFTPYIQTKLVPYICVIYENFF